MATTPKGTQFVVHLDGIKLPPKAEAIIAKEVRAAALRELARIDLRGDLAFRIPNREWLGIWIDRVPPVKLPIPRLR